jgi:hypothetical protein
MTLIANIRLARNNCKGTNCSGVSDEGKMFRNTTAGRSRFRFRIGPAGTNDLEQHQLERTLRRVVAASAGDDRWSQHPRRPRVSDVTASYVIVQQSRRYFRRLRRVVNVDDGGFFRAADDRLRQERLQDCVRL